MPPFPPHTIPAPSIADQLRSARAQRDVHAAQLAPERLNRIQEFVTYWDGQIAALEDIQTRHPEA